MNNEQYVRGMRHIYELMVENYAKVVHKQCGVSNDAFDWMRSSCRSVCRGLKDLSGQEIFLETELEELGKEKYLCVAKGQPFIRKALSSAWFVKISMNREFKKDLHDAYLLKGDTRINRFQEISDKYFDDDDYDKMTAKEMQWYVDKYLAEGGDEFLLSAVSDATCTVFMRHNGTETKVVKNAEIQTQDTDCTDELKRKVQSLEELLGKKQLELEKRTSAEMYLQTRVKELEEKAERLRKKGKKDYVAIDQMQLLKKCLQFAGISNTLNQLSERILRDYNYDESTVGELAPAVCEQIRMHLVPRRGTDCRPWNRKYLSSLGNKKCFSSNIEHFELMINDLLRLSTL